MNSLIESVIKNSVKSKTSSDSSISYEVALPIMFIIIFMLLLFLTYFIKEVVIQKRKFCFTKRNQNQHSQRNMIHPPGNSDYSQLRVPLNYANPTKLNESCQYYEEPRAGFYHVQKINSFNRNYNLNYEKIYSDKFKRMPSSLMIQIQNGQKLGKIDEINSYGLPSVKNLELMEPNQFERNLARIKSKSINLNNSQMHFKEKITKSDRLRRSYSNSKLDVKKWQSLMAKQKPSYNKNKKWPSKVMSEHELKLFLAQNKKLRLQGVEQTNNDLYRIKSFRNIPASHPNRSRMEMNSSNLEKSLNNTQTNAKKQFNNNNRSNDQKSVHLSFSFKDSTLSKLSQKLKEKTSEKNILKKILKEDKLEANSFTNKQTKNLKYSRLCKSFTFLSQKVTEDTIKKKLIESTKNSEKLNAFSSDPSKINSFASIKNNQNNYLKNLSAFKSKGFMSMSSIFKEVNSVSNWNKHKTEKEINCRVNDTNNDTNMQAISLMFSNSSSLNSQLTTLMQTNNFGSIMANFGSASIRGTQAGQSTRLNRHRTYSDGNGLSDTDTSRINVSEFKATNRLVNLPNQMSTQSVSFSKLVYVKNRV